jgi:alkanesulfonate monooxygenase SsuD/methylene tetrahydromethanopterin reductase-like flavin-dependent oxidoreductase (luciferase family)
VAATSPDSHRQAAEKGIGVLSSSSFLGYEYNRNALRLYDEAFDAATHVLPARRSKGILIGGAMHCAETTKQARAEAMPSVEYARLAVGAYERLSKLSADYAYMGAVKDVRFDDLDWMLNESGNFIIGDPDECIRQLEVVRELGVDTVLLRIDSLPHEQLLRSIELFGKYVIPHFKAPGTVVRPADDVLEEIRAMRPLHEERLKRRPAESAAAS